MSALAADRCLVHANGARVRPCRQRASQPRPRGGSACRAGTADVARSSVQVLSDVAEAAQTFEPRVDTTVLGAQLAVLGLTAAAGAYWWYVVVPSERAVVGRSKRMGGIKEYLDDIEGDEERGLERWVYTDWLRQRQERANRRAASQARRAMDAATARSEEVERASLAAENGGAEDEVPEGYTTKDAPEESLLKPAYETPMPAFFSLDNPLVTTTLLVGAGVAISALTRGAS
ncbi:unnamed protein product [Pedinophyceae sp. YPF-701]|nr:unnamed protein product [Pedinophyceae sp. YPF-701]